MEIFIGKTDDEGRPRDTYIKASVVGERAILNMIRVEPSLRGSGLADSLIEILVIALQKRGVKRLDGIFVPDEGLEERVKRFYERKGFTFEDRQKVFSDGYVLTWQEIGLDIPES